MKNFQTILLSGSVLGSAFASCPSGMTSGVDSSLTFCYSEVSSLQECTDAGGFAGLPCESAPINGKMWPHENNPVFAGKACVFNESPLYKDTYPFFEIWNSYSTMRANADVFMCTIPDSQVSLNNENIGCSDLLLTPEIGRTQWCPSINGDFLSVSSAYDFHINFEDIVGHFIVQVYMNDAYVNLIDSFEVNSATHETYTYLLPRDTLLAHQNELNMAPMQLFIECESSDHNACSADVSYSSYSSSPTGVPTSVPSSTPSATPTSRPSSNPTVTPTSIPTAVPTPSPTSFETRSQLFENLYAQCSSSLSAETAKLCTVQTSADGHGNGITSAIETLTTVAEALRTLVNATCV